MHAENITDYSFCHRSTEAEHRWCHVGLHVIIIDDMFISFDNYLQAQGGGGVFPDFLTTLLHVKCM